jgi:hypothetical protein
MDCTALHRRFLLKVLEIAKDRGNRQHPAVSAIAHETIAPLDVARDFDLVPFLGVTDVIDRYVVMLAPEERDVGKSYLLSEDISRCSLALAFGNDPMFNPEILARVRIQPPRNVAGGKNFRHAGLEVRVHGDTPVDLETSTLMPLAIFFTGDLLRECAFSSRASTFDQVRRLVRLARLLAIRPASVRHTATATLSIAEPAWGEKTVEHFAKSDRSASR